jgi:lipid II:glycine glycyltransferase (peptidoglycan interpeptide bridge formation enzyme)
MIHAFSGSAAEWNSSIGNLPGAHLLQTWEWGQVKATQGWELMRFVWESEVDKEKAVVAAAMVLKKRVISRGFAARLCILYAPKGPMLDWSNEALRKHVLDDMQSWAKKQGAIFLKIDPDIWLGTGVPGSENARTYETGQKIESELKDGHWLFSSEQIQFRNTVMIDLTRSEDEMLAGMKQKTRYNVRLAEKKGVTVRVGIRSDLPALYNMYAETSVRDDFVIRDEAYYRTVWETFLGSSAFSGETSTFRFQPFAEPLIAEVDGEMVAAIFVFYFAGRAYYIYGMSHEAHREKMPNYLLQWEAMRRAKARGCDSYDLWGAPDVFIEEDPLWGVFRFKEGLGGRVVQTLGAWDFPVSSIWYKTYTEIVPHILDLMRARGKARTRQSME